MSELSLDEIKKIVKSNTQYQGTLVFQMLYKSPEEYFYIMFRFVWWEAKKTYFAQPVVNTDNGFVPKSVKISNAAGQFLKDFLRESFAIEHVHYINEPNNESRINDLLGVKFI